MVNDMADFELTEQDLRNIAGVMEWEISTDDECECTARGKAVIAASAFGGDCLWFDDQEFEPLHDEYDLSRLVEAMQKAGYGIKRAHRADMTTVTTLYRVMRPNGTAILARPEVAQEARKNDLAATSTAIVLALRAESEG